MPKKGYTDAENKIYDDFLEKLNNAPSNDEVVRLLADTLNIPTDPNNRKSHNPIGDAKNDFFEQLLTSNKERMITQEQYERYIDIRTKLRKMYAKESVEVYNLIQEAREGVKQQKYKGTEWLMFPEDNDKIGKFAENIMYALNKQKVDRLENIQMNLTMLDMYGDFVFYDGPRNSMDEDGQIHIIQEKKNVHVCGISDENTYINDYYTECGVTDEKTKKKILKDFSNFQLSAPVGYVFNKNYKSGDSFVLKYPEDIEDIRKLKSKKQIDDVAKKLNAELNAIDDFDKACMEVAQKAQEMYDGLNEYEKDGDNSFNFQRMYDELYNITRMGKDMIVSQDLKNDDLTIRTDQLHANAISEAIQRMDETAKTYEQTHSQNAMSIHKYSRHRLEYSKQIQEFAKYAREKLDPKKFPGLNPKTGNNDERKRIANRFKKIKYYGEKQFGEIEFKKRRRNAHEVMQKLNNAMKDVSNATQKVHFGSSEYSDAAKSLKTAIEDYKAFTDSYLNPGNVEKTVNRAELKKSLEKAKEDINKYLDYKRDNGYIVEGKLADQKTQKRINAMQESLKQIDFALTSMNDVVKELNDEVKEKQTNYYDDIEKSFKQDKEKKAPKQEFDLDKKLSDTQAKLRSYGNDPDRNKVKEDVADIIAVNFINANKDNMLLNKKITETKYNEVKEDIKGNQNFKNLLKSKSTKELIGSASRDKGQDLLNGFLSGTDKSLKEFESKLNQPVKVTKLNKNKANHK
ncbi:MAG: hypothetical protein IJ871_01165 [Ruminococcus sp.]|nr:hypothetical protein [Ruminococcus sp.]